MLQRRRDRGTVPRAHAASDLTHLSDEAEVALAALVVSQTGEAALVASALPQPPADEAYEVRAIESGTPRPAGLFSPSGDRTGLALERAVPDGATVAVTVERAGGVQQPPGAPVTPPPPEPEA